MGCAIAFIVALCPCYWRGTCGLFQTVPIVLTVAATERMARIRQRFAEDVLTDERVTAQFDSVVSCSLHAAVQLEAHCRRCSHVFLTQESAAPRRRWRRGKPP